MKTKHWLYSIVASAAALRVPGLFGNSWYDENFSLLLARLDWAGLWAATQGDVHPPFYYLLLKLWTLIFGLNVISARAFSAVLSVLAVVVFWLMVAEWADNDRDRLILTGLFACNGFALYFAAETRMYALLLLLVLLAVWFINTHRWWLLSAVALALALTHNYGLFYDAALGIYALWRANGVRERQRVIPPFALAGTAWLVIWSPSLYAQMRQFSAGSGHWIELPTVGNILQTLTMLLFGVMTGPMVVLAVIATGGLLAVLLLHWRRINAPLAWLAFGPLIIAVTFSYLWTPVYLYRAFIGLVPFLIIIIYRVLVSIAKNNFRAWIMIGVFLVPVLGAGITFFYLDRDVARINSNGLLSGLDVDPALDIVYHTGDGTHVDMMWHRPDLEMYQLPACAGSNDQGALSSQTQNALGIQLTELDTLDYRRAWVVYLAGPNSDPCRLEMARQLIGDRVPVKIIRAEKIVYLAVYEIEGN